MKFFAQILYILRLEGQFFIRFPKLVLATVLVALIPAIYIVIYLASVWDPAARTSQLPVALVNLDQGIDYRDEYINVGREVAISLRTRHTFGFKDYATEDEARGAVRRGDMAFALIIPRGFSSNAVPGQTAGAGKLVIYASEGNNFETAMIARSFATTLGRDVNEQLNERRWSLVLDSAAGSQRSVQRLRDGVAQLQEGADELGKGSLKLNNGARQTATGMSQLADGVGQLTDGMKQLGSGLRTMDSKRPRNSDLDRLRQGAEELAAGQQELSNSLGELSQGSKALKAGVGDFRDEANDSFLVPARVGDGLQQVYSGASQLDEGLQQAHTGSKKLADGANQLNTGVGALTTGVRTMGSGIRTMVTSLPPDAKLAELEQGAATLATATADVADGTKQLKAGTDRLTTGLGMLADSLPARVDTPEGSAQGLANSVQPMVEVDASVPNSGSAFASNVIPAALWLGAGIAAFLIHVRVMPRQAQKFSRIAQVVGKALIPALIVIAQSLVIILTVRFALHIQVRHPMAFICALLVSALTFLAIVFALTRAFGDAGKALAMIFLAVQLSSSGGIVPVELSGSVFASISPWLPLTWVVRAMKASMFGAYESQWLMPTLIVGSVGLLAFASACWVGRWRYVKTTQVRPAVDF